MSPPPDLRDSDLLDFYLARGSREAAPWNLSPENLFVEMTTRTQLREWVEPRGQVCNVGIGAGEWDDYLGYWLGKTGQLTSIDADARICERFAYRQAREGHPHAAVVLNRSITDPELPRGTFDLVTMVGTTLHEIGRYEDALDACFSLLGAAGQLFYMDFLRCHSPRRFEEFAKHRGHTIARRAQYRTADIDFYALLATP